MKAPLVLAFVLATTTVASAADTAYSALRVVGKNEGQDALNRVRLIGDVCVGAFFAKEKDKDREKYLAIGESDRMTLRFVKP